MNAFISILLLSFMFISTAQAGFNGLTIHSRANCGNNESISWDGTNTWKLLTISQHYRNGMFYHEVEAGFDVTWRSAAVHWFEGIGGGWKVIGYHYIWQQGSPSSTLLGKTMATDCNIYNGWWDR